MHTTTSGNKSTALKAKARELTREAKTARAAAKTLPGAEEKARVLEDMADKALTLSERTKSLSRLEDLSVWVMEKVKPTKKGSRSYRYWMANWREGGKVRNVHLGSCTKLDAAAALKKARVMKAKALGIEQYC